MKALVVVKHTPNRALAEIARGVLEINGIQAVVVSSFPAGNVDEYAGAVEVLVGEKDARAALTVLAGNSDTLSGGSLASRKVKIKT